jgi:glycine/D-amino acid oxidase-like deaminating enzyme
MEELTRRLGPERAGRMFQLSLDAIRHVSSLIEEEAIACDFVRCGSISLAAKPSHMRGLEQGAQFMREHLGYETEVLSKEDLGREIASARYHGGLASSILPPARFSRPGTSKASLRRPNGSGREYWRASR